MALAMAGGCTINKNDDATTSITVTFKDYQPFGYLVWSNIVAAIMEAVGISLQLTGKEEDKEETDKHPKILLVLIDMAI
ncbi:hypothetical protein PR202_ga22332 [Eleusine coracana subsp. coracana]|uniref:Uncharacterized protein n=1 Tax=Eleusine coracana subsp. coracana TaxID=191504 RepID=A0AAV5D2U3_ELECO|nr:hypothetical protein PR202_ga22332 [Eleusine coracana subsp. coracana]